MIKRIYATDAMVRVFNPMDNDFTFKVNGVPFTIEAGKSRNLLGYQADLAIKHLVDAVMIAAGREKQMPRAGEAFFWHLDPASEHVEIGQFSAAMDVFQTVYIGVLDYDQVTDVPVQKRMNEIRSDMPLGQNAPISPTTATEVETRLAHLAAENPTKADLDVVASNIDPKDLVAESDVSDEFAQAAQAPTPTVEYVNPDPNAKKKAKAKK